MFAQCGLSDSRDNWLAGPTRSAQAGKFEESPDGKHGEEGFPSPIQNDARSTRDGKHSKPVGPTNQWMPAAL
jgi:hypothetical protein